MDDNNDDNHDQEFNSEEIPEEFLQMWSDLEAITLEPHLFVKQFTTFDEFADYLEGFGMAELMSLKHIYLKDKFLHKDYITVIDIYLRKITLKEIRSDLTKILGEVKEVDILLDYIDLSFL